MKKRKFSLLIAILLLLFVFGTASAQKNKINVKGEVTAIGAGSITVNSNKGEFIFTVPSNDLISGIAVGDEVLVKAVAGTDGSWIVESVKLLGQGEAEVEAETEDEDDLEQAEGRKDNSAYCAVDKKESPHPLAPKIAERYGVDESWVMDTFCNGYSIGAIMLALKTSQLEGVTAAPEGLLMGRSEGKGWGVIWKDLGLIGSEKEGHSPPGRLKKPQKK